MLTKGIGQGSRSRVSVFEGPDNSRDIGIGVQHTAPFHNRPDAEHSAKLGAFKSNWQVLRDYGCVQDGYTVY